MQAMRMRALAIALGPGKNNIIWRAEPERDRIFHLRVQRAESMQGGHCYDERLAWEAAGDFTLQLIRIESLGSELQES